MSETKASGSNYGVRSNNQKPSAGQEKAVAVVVSAKSPDLAGGSTRS
jgi:hypothetical protein